MTIVEVVCAALLLAYLVWVPLPFGSNVDAAFVPLVVPPLVLCAAAALLRFRVADGLRIGRAYRTWSIAALVLIAVVAFQLAPLPPALAAIISPESHAIWTAADRVTALAADSAASAHAHPISVDPPATRYELFRLIALFATFQAAALLLYTYGRRLAFAAALCITAAFESLYAIREVATQHYAIWGWTNELVFNRVSGTFVNPNHFAHYGGIVLPFSIYLGAIAWRNAANGRVMKFGRHVAALIERQFLLFAASIAAALACIAAVLLSQSRGALVSVVGGISLVIAILTGSSSSAEGTPRRQARRVVLRLVFGLAVLLLVIAGVAAYLGMRRTVSRFEMSDIDSTSLGGRRTGIEAALRVWRAFPLFGSGGGTFADVASIGQSEDLTKLYRHAHDDYAEAAATTGMIGVLVVVGFFVGLCQAWRYYLRREPGGSWRARAFGIAALTSVTIAAIHALIDFNFYIPANAATIAAIAGAAVALPVRARPREFEVAVLPPAA